MPVFHPRFFFSPLTHNFTAGNRLNGRGVGGDRVHYRLICSVSTYSISTSIHSRRRLGARVRGGRGLVHCVFSCLTSCAASGKILT